jgi:hypothetical protein
LAEVQAAENLRNSRKNNKAYFDEQKRFRGEQQQLHVGDLVLLHNTKKVKTYSSKNKFEDNWFGPYRIREIPENSTFYRLEELDGTHLAETFAGNRLKKFFSREALKEDRTQMQESIEADENLEESNDEEDDPGGDSRHVMLRM